MFKVSILEHIKKHVSVEETGESAVTITLTPKSIEILKNYYYISDSEYAIKIVDYVMQETSTSLESIYEIEDVLNDLEATTLCEEFLLDKLKLIIEKTYTTDENCIAVVKHCNENCNKCINFLL